MTTIGPRLDFINREQWRDWLKENHTARGEAWLLFYKKHTGKSCVPYEEAVEEALCFGWIDGLVKRLDDESHTIRFSPRKAGSVWSESNKRRVEKMIREGRMTEAGLAKVEEAKRTGEWEQASLRANPDTPDDLKQALGAPPEALARFETLAPSYRKQFLWWINSARTAQTRAKRIQETVRMVLENRKLGM
jgi:uncharacterized protein YdeI (YjbR/CyaY-like superfamily)